MKTLPGTRCLAVAVATPLTPDFRPDIARWLGHIRAILAAGCDGVTIFGTTGEGAEFPVEDRINALNALIAAGIPAGRVVVSVGTAAIADVVRLAEGDYGRVIGQRHVVAVGIFCDAGVAGDCVQAIEPGRLRELPGERMFAATRTQQQDIHVRPL